MISAPIGFRGILGEVRAPPLPAPQRPAPRESVRRKGTADTIRPEKPSQRTRPMLIPTIKPSAKGGNNLGTMSRGPFAGARSVQNMPPPLEVWLKGVKVGNPRDGSSGRGSGGDSGEVSRTGSRGRATSTLDRSVSQAYSRARERSISKDRFDEDAIPSLQEEITSVVNKLSPKLKLEKVRMSSRSICLRPN